MNRASAASPGRLDRSLRRSGLALIYAAVLMPVLLMIGSLGVDYAHVQVTKKELENAADAAAIYGAANLSTSSSAVSSAILAAADNKADGATVVLQSSDVQTGYWDTTYRTFSAGQTPLNAVKVTAVRSAAQGNAIAPLAFTNPGHEQLQRVGHDHRLQQLQRTGRLRRHQLVRLAGAAHHRQLPQRTSGIGLLQRRDLAEPARAHRPDRHRRQLPARQWRSRFITRCSASRTLPVPVLH